MGGIVVKGNPEVEGTCPGEADKIWTNPALDRSGWGPGPWDGEPDKMLWTDEATGLPCLAVRANPLFGNWCGYVAVAPGHPWHGRGYDEIPSLDVHGGLTYAAACRDEEPMESAVCHVPEPGQPADVWWFGWDCGHVLDVQPGLEACIAGLPRLPHASYKTLRYVRQECARLAAQLAEAERDAGGTRVPQC